MKKFLLFSALVIGCSSLYAFSFSENEVKRKEAIQPTEKPSDLFLEWYKEAVANIGKKEASCMVLATVNDDCEPSSRTMFLHLLDDGVLAFVGDKDSQKFEDIEENNHIAITFNWFDEQRSVDIIGKAKLLSSEQLQGLWDKQSKAEQISYHISKQGEEIKNLDSLKEEQAKKLKQYNSESIPMPENYEGYQIEPQRVLFWQAGAGRMNSRVMYELDDGEWEHEFLAP